MSAAGTVRVAIVGATELAGTEIVSLLDERGFPVSELRLYGSAESEGDEVEFRGATMRVEKVPDATPKVDVAFLCAAVGVRETLAAELAAAGAMAIDLSPAATGGAGASPVLGIGDIAPTARQASGGLLVRMADPLARLAAVPLRALGTLADLERVIGTFLVPASAFGRERVGLLGEQTTNLLNLREAEGEESTTEFPFRCIPDRSSSVASTSNRIAGELGRLLGDRPRVLANVVEVPVFFGQAVSLAVEFRSAVDAERGRAALRETASLLLVEGERRLSTLDVVDTDGIFILDLHQRSGDERWLSFWALGDNVRQGSALPAVALAESLLGSSGQAAG